MEYDEVTDELGQVQIRRRHRPEEKDRPKKPKHKPRADAKPYDVFKVDERTRIECTRADQERRRRQRLVPKILNRLQRRGAKFVCDDIIDYLARSDPCWAMSDVNAQKETAYISRALRNGFFDAKIDAVVWIIASSAELVRLNSANVGMLNEDDLRDALNSACMTASAWQKWFAYRQRSVPETWPRPIDEAIDLSALPPQTEPPGSSLIPVTGVPSAINDAQLSLGSTPPSTDAEPPPSVTPHLAKKPGLRRGRKPAFHRGEPVCEIVTLFVKDHLNQKGALYRSVMTQADLIKKVEAHLTKLGHSEDNRSASTTRRWVSDAVKSWDEHYAQNAHN